MGKKYFWLKLKEDFFMQKEIKKLRKIAGGDTYTIIYLKLQLLSVKNEGKIIYEGTEESLVEQLALEIDEDPENIKVLLLFLEKNKLIEQVEENEYLLIKASECIGKESDSAERVRKHREQQRLKDDKSKKTLQCNTQVTNCNTEKEKEEEKELEKERRTITTIKEEVCCDSSCSNSDIYEFYSQCGFGLLNHMLMEMLDADVTIYGKEWVKDALKEAVKQNKYKLSYAEGILRNWKSNGRGDDDGSSKQNNGTSSKYKDYDFRNRTAREGVEYVPGDDIETDY